MFFDENNFARNQHFVEISSFRVDPTTGTPESPGNTARQMLYNALGVPHKRMQGYSTVSNANDSATLPSGVPTLNNYNNRADELMGRGMRSPFLIEPTLTLDSETGHMIITADVEVVGNQVAPSTEVGNLVNETTIRGTHFFLTGTNRIYFIVTLNNPTDTYRNRVVYFWEEIFTPTTTGAEISYSFDTELLPVWGLENYTAVVFIQRMHITNTSPIGIHTYAPPNVYQVASAKFEETIYFDAEITMGYIPFEVGFNNLSNITGPATYTWNFGDGSEPLVVTFPYPDDTDITHTVESVSHTYTSPAIHTVTLTISRDGLPEKVFTRSNYIQSIADIGEEIFVSGNIVGTVPANTVINVIGDVTVPVNGHLIIRHGATINVAPGVKFEVFGNLEVRGTPDAPVLFTSNTTWEGIHFMGTVNDPVCVIEHAIFRNSTGAVRSARRTLHILYCEFTDNVSTGAGNAPAIDLTTSGTNNGGSAAGPHGPSIIRGCFFTRNRSGVIQLDKSIVTIQNCVFVNNTGSSSGAILLKFFNSTLIENCTFFSNHYTGAVGGTLAMMGSGAATAPDVTIVNTILEGRPPIHINDANPKASVAYSAYIDTRTTASPHNRITFHAGNLFRTDFAMPNHRIFVNPTDDPGHTHTTVRNDWILHSSSICIDAGHPGAEYFDREDEENAGQPLPPALGTRRNDMGAFGGNGFHSDVVEPELPVVVWGKIFYRLPGEPADFPALNPTIMLRGGDLLVPIIGTYVAETGNYQIANIPPMGVYELTVTAPRAEQWGPEILPIGTLNIPNLNIQISYTPPEPTDPIIITGLLRFYEAASSPPSPVPNPTIRLTGGGLSEPIIGTYNPETMVYAIDAVPLNAEYVIEITATEFFDFTHEVNVTTSDILSLNLTMTKKPISDTEELRPHVTMLYGAFPNPFNPTTTIAFDMSAEEFVTIEVFNIKGQKVTTLVNDIKEAGRYLVVWNGIDENGRNVGSGVYLYRMTTESFTSTQKMILMK
jgi:PKD repeat protein